jgi:two-component system response regulator FlrC
VTARHDTKTETESETMTARRILVVDDEPGMRAGLAEVLGRGGFEVELAGTGEEALERLRRAAIDLLVTDVRLPGLSGLELLRLLRDGGNETPAIVITAHGTIEDAVAAMKLGALDFLTKPFSPADVLHVAARTIELAAAGSGAGAPTPPRRPIVTGDPEMLRLLEVADTIASSRAPVLIQGESGTGKELLARHLHERGCRRGRPFVAVGCAALPRDVLESELFGHERGAFAGALVRKLGKFELATGGTLLLDDVSELEPGLQAKLVRVLQEYEIERLGGTRPVPIDVRVVATTSRRLRDLVDAGRFRDDLFYRLNVVPLVLPPLRARPGDVALLAEHFLERFAGGARLRFDDAARSWLESRPWPGNVRELEHALERAALLVRGGVLSVADLDDHDAVPPRLGIGAFAGLTVREMERRLIVDTLKRTHNNRTQAAKLLGISIRTLRNKLAEYRSRGELELSLEPGN